jgi:hypothetical protein
MQPYHLLEARYLGGHAVWLRFWDGTSGDPAVFSRFTIHPPFHTLVWENGADFAPEFLHDNVRVTA